MFARKVHLWGIDPGRNMAELRANLENSVLRYEAAEYHRESDGLRDEWRTLFGRKKA